jgi:hypothetical protein
MQQFSPTLSATASSLEESMNRKPSELHLDEILSDAKNEPHFEMQEEVKMEDGQYDSAFPAPMPLLSYHETHNTEIPYRDMAPPKTGTGQPMMAVPPTFIEDVEPYEPIYIVQENI